MMIAYIFYSHYDYSDIWPLLFGQSEKFLKDQKKILFTNKVDTDKDYGDWEVVLYDDSLPYQKRVISCLEKIDSELVVFHHEDMFLYDHPKRDVIEECSVLVKQDRMDFVKLGRANYRPQEPLVSSFIHEKVYQCPLDLQFAIQPTICKRQNLIKIYEQTPGDSIWKFEANSSVVALQNSFRCFMTSEPEESKRGMFHWDSHIYPYFSTAVVKGKWDFESYPVKMKNLLEEYGIDPEIRGKNV